MDACIRATEGISVVYHIAAAYRDASLSPEDYGAINHQGSVNLFDAAAENGVSRFIHCSTVGVHGEIHGPPAAETAPFHPDDAYQESKVAAEHELSLRSADTDMDLVIFRPTGIYGPGDLRLLKFIRMIAKGRFFMIGDGMPRYHLTYIDDLIDGIILCGTRAEAANETFIIGGPEAPTLNQWAHIVAEELGVSKPGLHLPVSPFMVAARCMETICRPLGITPPIHTRRMDFFTKNRAFDIRKARDVIGYDPRIHVREGMRRTILWYRQHGYI